MLATTVAPVKRLALRLLLVLPFAALGAPGAANDDRETRILHLDGSGTATIVDVHPSIPGAADFIRATPGPIPRPGEIILPAGPTPTWSPAPTPTLHRYGSR
jgi:hypothetical protein